MEYLQAIVLGAVQGLTEFLPISSDGHLFIVREVFSWPDQGLLFDAVLHLGTLAAILVVLWRGVADLFVGAWQIVAQRSFTKTPQQRLVVAVVIATIPGALAGYFLQDLFTDVYRNVLSVGLWFLATGAFYFFAEFVARAKTGRTEPGLWRALAIGVAQATALLPGVSRSGMTIATASMLGVTREAAARFSFVMAVPIIAGASVMSLIELMQGQEQAASLGWGPLVVGTVVAFVVGLAALKALLKLVKQRGLRIFGVYLRVLGALVVGLHVGGVW